MKKEESIVKPEYKGPEIPEGRLLFLPFLPFPQIISKIRKEALSSRYLNFSELFYLGKKAVLYGPLGASASISTLEKVRLLGVREIILLSYCGSLSEKLRFSQAFVPELALSEEGTSKHYLPKKDKSYSPAPEALLNLKNYLIRHNLPFISGSIVSTDAPYRETLSWVKKMQKKGIMAVDMEASAVLAFSEFYGIKTSGLFLVSDELFKGFWFNGLKNKCLLEATKKYFFPIIFEE